MKIALFPGILEPSANRPRLLRTLLEVAEASSNAQWAHEFEISGYSDQISISSFAEFSVLEFTFFEKRSNLLGGLGFSLRLGHETSFQVELLSQDIFRRRPTGRLDPRPRASQTVRQLLHHRNRIGHQHSASR